MANRWTNLGAATAAVTNRYVVSVAMKVGTYTIANSGLPPTSGARLVTIDTRSWAASPTPWARSP